MAVEVTEAQRDVLTQLALEMLLDEIGDSVHEGIVRRVMETPEEEHPDRVAAIRALDPEAGRLEEWDDDAVGDRVAQVLSDYEKTRGLQPLWPHLRNAHAPRAITTEQRQTIMQLAFADFGRSLKETLHFGPIQEAFTAPHKHDLNFVNSVRSLDPQAYSFESWDRDGVAAMGEAVAADYDRDNGLRRLWPESPRNKGR